MKLLNLLILLLLSLPAQAAEFTVTTGDIVDIGQEQYVCEDGGLYLMRHCPDWKTITSSFKPKDLVIQEDGYPANYACGGGVMGLSAIWNTETKSYDFTYLDKAPSKETQECLIRNLKISN